MRGPLIPELPSFDDPVAMLRACHDRMLDHCLLLEKLVVHVQEKGPDSEANSAASRVLRYFSTAARLHHQDEEQDLFPLLTRQSIQATDLVFALRKEHEQLDRLWEEVAPVLRKVQDIGANGAFARQVEDFCRLTRSHIQRENHELLPLARHSLSWEQLKEIGREMEKRRRSD